MPCGGTNMRKKAGVFFAEGAGGFGLAKVFEVRGEGGQVGQGFFVVGAFFAAGLFQAATEHLRVVLRGNEERVELERVLAMRTRGEKRGMMKAEG